MSPYNVHDDLSPKRGSEGGRHAVPDDTTTDRERREWLEWAFSLPDGWQVGDVKRHGGGSHTPMTVEIVPPGDGKAKVVRLEEERDAAKQGTLRLALTRDAGLRAAPITNAKVAGDAYYVLCALAQVIGGGDPRDEAREWIDGYRQEAVRLDLSLAKPDLYVTLDQLRRHPYSKRQISLWLSTVESHGMQVVGGPPCPPLVIDASPRLEDGERGEWTSITHLATYVRWGRDQPGTISGEALAGRVIELGGKRWRAAAWDDTTRQRQSRIITVLVRLPRAEDAPEEDEEAPDV
jgi:hypothetical protein